MPPDTDSSLLDGPQQPMLPLDADLAPTDPAAPIALRLPVFTGEGVFRRDPERYALFCRLFFDAGLGQMEVCRLMKMSPQTGAAIIAREQQSMTADRLRSCQLSRARSVVTLALSAIQDRLLDPGVVASTPLRDLSQALQRAHDVAELLDGRPTARVARDSEQPASAADQAADYLRSLATPAATIGPPSTDLDGETGYASRDPVPPSTAPADQPPAANLEHAAPGDPAGADLAQTPTEAAT